MKASIESSLRERGSAPHPSREDTSRTHRLLDIQKSGSARASVVEYAFA